MLDGSKGACTPANGVSAHHLNVHSGMRSESGYRVAARELASLYSPKMTENHRELLRLGESLR